MSFLSFISELFGGSNGSAQAVTDDDTQSTGILNDFRPCPDEFVETKPRPKSKAQATEPARGRTSKPSIRERKLEVESRRRNVTQVKKRLHMASKELDDTISDIKMKA